MVPARLREPCYPDSDGQPMADNTLQFEWITTLKWGCEALFADRPDVFVAGDHLIFPVDDPENIIQFAPDVYVAFGRPKGHRGSYKVWEEAGIFPQVLFEVWSPGNRFQQMEDKRKQYELYGAEEYYIVYPERPAFVEGWLREEGKLVRIEDLKTWVSPRLGVRFEIRKGNLNVVRPDGTKFLTYLEINEQLSAERRRTAALTAERDGERERAEQEANRADQAANRADQEANRADQAANRADQAANRADQEANRATAAEERAARMAAKLRELGLDPDAT